MSSCDDAGTNRQLTSNNNSITSSITGNAVHDSLIATSLGTLIDDGIIIDSILFIGIDSSQLLGVVVLDNEDQEHTAVSMMDGTAEDRKTAKAMCRCLPNHIQPPFPGQCGVSRTSTYWGCDGASCCGFHSDEVSFAVLDVGMVALHAISHLPPVTIMGTP